MPNNATTRKCHMKRNMATRKLAAQRRKLSEKVLTFNQKVHQFLMDKMHGMLNDTQKQIQAQKNISSKMNKLLMKTLDMDRFAKHASIQYIINQHIKHLPPMSAQQETHLIEQLKTILDMGQKNLKKIKTIKSLHYNNPYPLKPTAMPDLYVGTNDCAWDSDDVGTFYTKRQASIKAFYTMIEKNAKFMDQLKIGSMAELFAIVDENMMLMKSLPPGPNKESEKERIEYLELSKEIMEDTLDLLKYVMKEINKLIGQMKKEMAKK